MTPLCHLSQGHASSSHEIPKVTLSPVRPGASHRAELLGQPGEEQRYEKHMIQLYVHQNTRTHIRHKRTRPPTHAHENTGIIAYHVFGKPEGQVNELSYRLTTLNFIRDNDFFF